MRALCGLLALAPAAALAQPGPPILPRQYSDHRTNTIRLDSVVREDRPWLQLGVAGALYDARRDVIVGRWSPGVQGGWRFTHFGLFGTVELDQTFDFTTDTDRLDLLNVGVGVEVLQFVGHVRSSVAAGASILLADTLIDEAGETGWFVDLRPAAIRWGLGDAFAVELTPFAFDVVAPVTEGLPLVVLSYTTVLAVEWAP